MLQKMIKMKHLNTPLSIMIAIWLPLSCLSDDSYEHVNTLMSTKLGAGNYNPDLRPVANQSEPVNVEINFAPMSLVQVDDVMQRFVINGFLSLEWTDQRISWDPDDYGGVDYLTPQPKHIWRPRVLLWNTLSDRDLFKDDISPLRVRYDGSATWNPGGLFRGACALNMEKYPFDEQWCYIRMCPMSHYWTKLLFVPSGDEWDLSFFSPSEGWDLTETKVSTVRVETDVKTKFSSCPNFSFKIKRRPTFFVFNIILPVNVLAFLNTMVYVIPNESGEKIGYGITVLLALSMFLTTVSMMVPQASAQIPRVTVYLFVLMMISVLSVLTSIIIVYLHHLAEGEKDENETLTRSDSMGGSFFKRFFNTRHSASSVTPMVDDDNSSRSKQDSIRVLPDPMASGKHGTSSSGRSFDDPKRDEESSRRARCKVICKHINRGGFVASSIALVIVNAVFIGYLKG